MTGIPGRFGAVLTAMVTPFHADGSLDVDAAVRIARWLVDNGSDGLVVTGTTGESPTLRDDEKIELWRAVAEAVTVPVIAGSGTYDTAHSVHLAREAASAGAAGILAVTPYYNRPSQAGLVDHYTAIATATPLPVMLYDIPHRTGRKVEHATVVRLAHELPTVVALKDAAQNPGASAAIIADTPDGFELYSGDDVMTLPFLAVGAVGVVSVAAHWIGNELQDLLAAFAKADVEEARRVNARLLPSYAFLGNDVTPSPAPTKAMLRVLGVHDGPMRPPMTVDPDDDADLARRAAELLADLGRGV